jgi:hypothetical protein
MAAQGLSIEQLAIGVRRSLHPLILVGQQPNREYRWRLISSLLGRYDDLLSNSGHFGFKWVSQPSRLASPREDLPPWLRASVSREVGVPLSEQEQRAFEALEEAVGKQDPTFADRLRPKNAWLSSRDLRALSICGFVLGLGLLIAFCWTSAVSGGVIGFLIVLVSLDTFWTNCQLDRFRHDR